MKKKKKHYLWPLFIFLGILTNPILLLIIFVIVCFSIEDKKIYTFYGMDYYYKNHYALSSVQLTKYWIPQEDIFWNDFQYKEADFWYEIKYTFNETCILYVKYDADIYKNAKSFVLDKATLCKNHSYLYRNSYFLENLDLPISNSTYLDGDNTNLKWGNYIGYNDEDSILFFIGVYISDKNNPLGNEITSSEVFVFDLERYFSNYLELF